MSVLIGIAGGSGSGKSHFARQVQRHAGERIVSVLSMDQYFSTEGSVDAQDINFDHPAHLDLNLMLQHLEELKSGRSVAAPSYDFRTMKQTLGHVPIEARPVVLVEGLFVLAKPIVDLMDLTCFLDVELDQRLLGRILRDLQERNSTIERIIDRYQRFVRPSYHVFVAPSMQNADIVVDFTYRRHFFLELMSRWVRDLVEGRIDLSGFVAHVRGESYRLGYSAQQAYMPTALDIRDLAKAYPESAHPPAAPESPEPSPRLFLEDEPVAK